MHSASWNIVQQKITVGHLFTCCSSTSTSVLLLGLRRWSLVEVELVAAVVEVEGFSCSKQICRTMPTIQAQSTLSSWIVLAQHLQHSLLADTLTLRGLLRALRAAFTAILGFPSARFAIALRRSKRKWSWSECCRRVTSGDFLFKRMTCD